MIERMDRKELVDFWKKEESESFSGWDFAHTKDRVIEDALPWDYVLRTRQLLESSTSVLEIGTGGGERFLELKDHWPDDVVATEGHAPNFALARQRLEPLGVKVVELESSNLVSMPFKDDRFDLVLNRHAAFNPAEIGRILNDGGVFYTQQVHGLWCQDLLKAFDSKPQWPDAVPGTYIPKLEKAFLRIVRSEEWSGGMEFRDVGAIVYQLKNTPWLVPDFSVASHLPHLLALQEILENGKALSFTAMYYLIEAVKREYVCPSL